MKRALIIEDELYRMNGFFQNLPGFELTFTNKVREAIQLLKTRRYDMVFIDYDLDKAGEHRKGIEVIKAVTRCASCYLPILWVVHSKNPFGGPEMARMLIDKGADVVYYPFAWEDQNLLRSLSNMANYDVMRV